MWEPYFTQILEDAFAAAKEKDPKLSLRGFAKRLGVSASVLSEILRGKRSLVPRRAMAVAEKADVPSHATARLRRMIESLEDDSASRRMLQGEALELIMNPSYYAILSALEILPVPCPLSELSSFVRLERKETEELITRLEKYKIVERESEHVYWWGLNVTTSSDIPSDHIRNFHRRHLARTAESLETIPVTEREVTTITFAGSTSRLALGKSEIRKFRDAMETNMRGKTPDRVYQLSIQLIPVSESLKGKAK